jgi:hypothetical protein
VFRMLPLLTARAQSKVLARLTRLGVPAAPSAQGARPSRERHHG